MSQNKGRVTIPTNLDVVKETLDIVEKWGADAIRDCDGTEFPGRTQRHRCKDLRYLLYNKKRIMHGQRQTRMRSSRCTS